MSGGKVVLIAVDPSPQAEQAVKYYMENVHKPGNQVLLVHVAEIPDHGHARQEFLSPATMAELWKEEGELSKKLAEKFKKTFEAQAISDVRLASKNGTKPGEVICKTAQEENASLLVIGTRGMGKIRRTILGSVSDYVIHHAHCPVIVCRDAAEHMK